MAELIETQFGNVEIQSTPLAELVETQFGNVEIQSTPLAELVEAQFGNAEIQSTLLAELVEAQVDLNLSKETKTWCIRQSGTYPMGQCYEVKVGNQ